MSDINPMPCVLIAEDDAGHATLILRNLRRAGFDSNSVHLKDGQELLDYIYRRAPWTARQVHESLAIIVDLNMPRLGGFDILKHLKRDDVLARIPIFVLTTTDDPRELDRCYALGAAGYMVKPVDYGLFSDLVRRLAEFLTAVHLPGESSAQAPCHGP